MVHKAANFAGWAQLGRQVGANFPNWGPDLRSHIRAIIVALGGPDSRFRVPGTVSRERDMALRTLIGRRTALGAAVVMLWLAVPAIAADGDGLPARTDIATPSVEELAMPPEKDAADAGRETDTREAMCLMIESAARAKICRSNSSPA